MEAKNVFELAILNGTGRWQGLASIASSSSNYNAGFSMPSTQFQIDRFFEGQKMYPPPRYIDGRVGYDAVGLPKEFIAVLIDRYTCQNVALLGKLYGGFPSIFNFQPVKCRGWYTFSKKDEFGWCHCTEIRIRFFFPSHLKERKLIYINFSRPSSGDDSIANWKVDIKIDTAIVHSYFYKRNPDIFGN